MNKVIVKTTLRVTKIKGKASALEVYEIEQRISQGGQQAVAANGCHCAHSANQDNNGKKKITVALEY
jgi:hypothetical protein